MRILHMEKIYLNQGHQEFRCILDSRQDIDNLLRRFGTISATSSVIQYYLEVLLQSQQLLQPLLAYSYSPKLLTYDCLRGQKPVRKRLHLFHFQQNLGELRIRSLAIRQQSLLSQCLQSHYCLSKDPPEMYCRSRPRQYRWHLHRQYCCPTCLKWIMYCSPLARRLYSSPLQHQNYWLQYLILSAQYSFLGLLQYIQPLHF
mmetsp:Transcript_3991/g.4613  ORF Transcript_3991/g.4613 Transcript_3991/m.4613 type:complete len:201 (-) Transcript_3991:1414-2016(-)